MEIWYILLATLLSLGAAGCMVWKSNVRGWSGGTLFVTWMLLFCALSLTLLDLSSDNSSRKRDLSSASMLVFWEIIYWLLLFMNYLVLPLSYDYYSSPHFRIKDRCVDVLRSNLRSYGIFFVLLTVCLLLIFPFVSGITWEVPTIVSVMAEVYSSAWFFGVLGIGIVLYPYRIYQKYVRVGNLNSDYAHFYRTVGALASVDREVEQLYGQIHFFDQSINDRDPLRPYVDELLRLTAVAIYKEETPTHLSYADLVAIHKRLRELLSRQIELRQKREKLLNRIREIRLVQSKPKMSLFRRATYVLLFAILLVITGILLWNEWSLIPELTFQVNLSPLALVYNSGLPWYVIVLLSSGSLIYLFRLLYVPLGCLIRVASVYFNIGWGHVFMYRTLTYSRMLFPLLWNYLFLSGQHGSSLEQLLYQLRIHLFTESLQLCLPWLILPVVIMAIMYWYKYRTIDTPEEIAEGCKLVDLLPEQEMDVMV